MLLPSRWLSRIGFLANKQLNNLGLRPENALLRTRFFVTFLAMKKVKKKEKGTNFGFFISHRVKEKNLSF
jgi:hypothetical protein